MARKKKRIIDTRKWYRYQFFGNATIKLPKENRLISATVANISFSGIGLYSSVPVGKGKEVRIKVSFVDRHGKTCEDITYGKVDWESKFENRYLVGILFDEELNMSNQPALLDHLMWLINTHNWPQPYKDKRIAAV